MENIRSQTIGSRELQQTSVSSYFGLSPRWERLFILMWLLFLGLPAASLFASRVTWQTQFGVLLAIVLYLAMYVILVWRKRIPNAHSRVDITLIVALTLLTIATNAFYGANWMELFFFISSAIGLRFPPRTAIWAIGALIMIWLFIGWTGHAGFMNIGVTVLVIVGLGFGMLGFVRMGSTIRELHEAREQIQQLAAAEAIADERLRIARDLHDILGHSLSVITLKTELSRRLIETAPYRAIKELTDVESVAREALKTVRQTVLAYRQPTLSVELADAQEILEAAAIDCRIKRQVDSLAPLVDATFAWCVREAVTNVIRHAQATFCEMTLQAHGEWITLTVTNDGCDRATLHSGQSHGVKFNGVKFSGVKSNGVTGSGLLGLKERVSRVGGIFHAGSTEDGGFCVAASVPIDNEWIESNGQGADE